MSDRLAEEMFPVAAALAVAIDEEDADLISDLLTTLSTRQLYALAVVLAAHVDTSQPFRRKFKTTMVQRLTQLAAVEFQVEVVAIRSEVRTKELVTVRDVITHAARLLGDSYPTIGRYLNRDHTTVIAAQHRALADPQIRAAGEALAVRVGWTRTDGAA